MWGSAHRRELKGLSPVRPPPQPSCHLLLTTRPYGGTGVQPRPHSGFLRPPAAWTAGEKPADPWQARPQPRLRPRALALLASRVAAAPCPPPTSEPPCGPLPCRC